MRVCPETGRSAQARRSGPQDWDGLWLRWSRQVEQTDRWSRQTGQSRSSKLLPSVCRTPSNEVVLTPGTTSLPCGSTSHHRRDSGTGRESAASRRGRRVLSAGSGSQPWLPDTPAQPASVLAPVWGQRCGPSRYGFVYMLTSEATEGPTQRAGHPRQAGV
ncbi:uncharacterized protein LOC143504571 [Brachyhypopomus gauderio]|uniref:uncharacterized protein LOC143504571 n=1 Tax=Brachyhypopomus gauderio TaxID=698409 RepID=UPI004041C14C